MAQASAARAGPAEELVDVLALAFAGEFHQTQFGELGDLRSCRIVAGGLGEMFQQLQLVAAGIHVDEIDDHHAADVAQPQLPGDLHRRLAVGPQHRLAGVGRAGEGARVHINHGERLGGLDDHVAPRGQVDPGLEGVADGGVDLVVLKNLAGLFMVLHREGGLIGAEEGVHPGHRVGSVHHDPHDLRAVEVAQHPVDEVLIPVEQHGGAGGLGRLLDRLPLAQQRFKVVDQEILADPFGLGADQEAGARGLDQHPQSPQSVALVLAIDAPGDAHPLAMGLKHQEAARQGEVAREPGTLRAGWFLHHLHQNLLARFKQLGDAGTALAQPEGAEIGDVNEAVLFAFADVDESGVDTGEHILDGAEIDITDLVATLGDDQFVDPFVAEHRRDPQVLSDDDLLGHGKFMGSGEPCPGGQEKEERTQLGFWSERVC